MTLEGRFLDGRRKPRKRSFAIGFRRLPRGTGELGAILKRFRQPIACVGGER